MELTREYIKHIIQEAQTWKPGETRLITFGEWDLTLLRDNNIYAPYVYTVKGVRRTVTVAKTHETIARRYLSVESALLHICNRFNENDNLKNIYSSLDEVLAQKGAI